MDNRSIPELFTELMTETRTLLRQEMDLMKAEMSEKMTSLVKDVAELGVGAAMAYTGLLALVAAAIFGLAEVMSLWLSALIIGIVITAVGFWLIMKGKKDLTSEKLAPEKTVETMKETAKWAKSEMK